MNRVMTLSARRMTPGLVLLQALATLGVALGAGTLLWAAETRWLLGQAVAPLARQVPVSLVRLEQLLPALGVNTLILPWLSGATSVGLARLDGEFRYPRIQPILTGALAYLAFWAVTSFSCPTAAHLIGLSLLWPMHAMATVLLALAVVSSTHISAIRSA